MMLSWPIVSLMSLVIALAGWAAPVSPAASVSTHPFGRYEILLQERTPVAMGEFLGVVRRQTGLPEYPLMLGARQRRLDLHVLGPGNRPYRLTSTEFLWGTRSQAVPARFFVVRSVREGEQLVIQLRHASQPADVRLAVDLRGLQRLLEGER